MIVDFETILMDKIRRLNLVPLQLFDPLFTFLYIYKHIFHSFPRFRLVSGVSLSDSVRQHPMGNLLRFLVKIPQRFRNGEFFNGDLTDDQQVQTFL